MMDLSFLPEHNEVVRAIANLVRHPSNQNCFRTEKVRDALVKIINKGSQEAKAMAEDAFINLACKSDNHSCFGPKAVKDAFNRCRLGTDNSRAPLEILMRLAPLSDGELQSVASLFVLSSTNKLPGSLKRSCNNTDAQPNKRPRINTGSEPYKKLRVSNGNF